MAQKVIEWRSDIFNYVTFKTEEECKLFDELFAVLVGKFLEEEDMDDQIVMVKTIVHNHKKVLNAITKIFPK